MEGTKRRYSPRTLMALALAMTGIAGATKATPMNEDSRRQRHRPIEVSRLGSKPSRSKYTAHQGSKECARRLKQEAKLAAKRAIAA